VVYTRAPVIRLFIDSLEAGGNERDCFHLCNGWANQKLCVELLLVRAVGPFLKKLDPRVVTRDLGSSRALKSFFKTSRCLRQWPEVPVLTFGFHLGAGLIAMRKIGLHRSPVIYREGSSPLSNIKPSRHWIYRRLLATAARVIAQNQTAFKELHTLGVPAAKISIIPNPGPIVQSQALHPDARVDRNQPLILGVGRLSPEKGFDRLIRAFKLFCRDHPQARLTILGEGAERSRLESLVRGLDLAKSVSLPGFVQDLSSWYRSASLFVLSSYYEGQPNALVEAITHRCPVLCAEGKGGIVDLMQNCALLDCLVPDCEFESRFVRCACHVLSKPASVWERASGILRELMDPETILARYLQACRSSHSAVENPRQLRSCR
jgi:glycosyltransferase involved in cell wall biosynthesis